MDPVKVSYMKFADSVRIQKREEIFWSADRTPHMTAEYRPDLGVVAVTSTKNNLEVVIPVSNILSFEIEHDNQPEQGDSGKGPQRKGQGQKAT